MVEQLLEPKTQNAKERLASLVQEFQKGLQIKEISVHGYEKVLRVTNPKVGLDAIIAIHSTALGPTLGGIRIYPYASFDEALKDALRLSMGMTYKSALAEVGFGGGKSVIIADPRTAKTPELLLAFGIAVESLQGQYICAEDMGSTVEDVRVIRRATRYVVGLPHEKSSGNPSPFTAWGTFRGIQSVCKWIYGSDCLEGKKVAIQGLGSVGSLLAELLFWAGAELVLADKDQEKVEELCKKYGAKSADPEEILEEECDILAPCARGGILNDKTIRRLRCKAIAGCANNQLENDSDAQKLQDRGILYAPDFVINAGGLLNVSAELEDEGYDPRSPRYKTHHIYDTLLAIYKIAKENKESTQKAALSLAEYRMRYGIGKRVIPPTFHHTAD